MKFKENIIEIMKGAVSVHCDTQKKAKALLKELAGHSVRWRGCGDLTTDTEWNQYKAETCYQLVTQSGLDFLTFSNRENCETEGDKIIKFEELLEAEDEQENDNDNNDNDNLAIKVNGIIHDLIDYADKECEKTIHTAEAYRDGYIKGCKDSLGEVRAILSELNNN